MVAHEAAMAPELRAAGGGAHLLHPSGAEPEIESRLLGREKRTALLRLGGPVDVVFHLRYSLKRTDQHRPMAGTWRI